MKTMASALDMNSVKSTIEENEYQFTNKTNEAIYLFSDGSMIDGQFECGSRGEDHRMIECLIDDLNRYDGEKFWDAVHNRLNVVRMVPETKFALIKVGQKLSVTQKQILKKVNYIIEEY